MHKDWKQIWQNPEDTKNNWPESDPKFRHLVRTILLPHNFTKQTETTNIDHNEKWPRLNSENQVVRIFSLPQFG